MLKKFFPRKSAKFSFENPPKSVKFGDGWKMDVPTYRPAKQGGMILSYKMYDYSKHEAEGKRTYYKIIGLYPLN